MAADPTKFPEQLKFVQPWQAKRLYANAQGFGPGGGRGGAQPADPVANALRLEIDTGDYSPELGYSYAEIAGMSRSQHRSQAMGSPERKGSQKTYLNTEVGDRATKDFF